MATSDARSRGITVTIKYGTGYDQPWVVFHGLPDEVKQDIIAFFGLASVSDTALTLSDLVVNATQVAHAVGAVASGLGATVIATEPAAPTAAEGTQASSSDPWVQASTAPTEAVGEPAPLLAQIDQAPTVRALERLWLDNQDAFTDPAVMAAWKAKGRALSAGS